MAFCEERKHCVVWLMMTVAAAVMQTSLCQAKVTMEDHGYKGVVVVIDNDVPEDKFLLTKLEESLTAASKVLFRATRNRLYFEEFVIVIPQSWSSNVSYSSVFNLEDTREQILISNSKSEHGNAPYVRQNRGCGEPGLFMHLTPSYITNDSVSDDWGPRGKAIVHEWGHLRWGLFDEYAIPGTSKVYKKNEMKYTTKCTENIQFQQEKTEKIGGKAIVHEWGHLRWGLFDEYGTPDTGKSYVKNEKKNSMCTEDIAFEDRSATIGNFSVTMFIPKTNSTPVASLMFAHYIPSIVEFCDDPNSPNESLRHNIWAANRQNTYCNRRSAWEVMNEHSDFKQNFTSLESLAQARPIQFKYVQVKPPRRVLVLDTSGSMNTDNRLKKMNNAATKVILTWLETGSSLGIVRFSDNANILSEVVTVSTEADRRNLISRLPTSASAYTSIGAGLRSGVEILHRGMDTASGGTIILISDGEENRLPLMADVLPEILQRSVVVHTIGVTELADHFMSNLSTSTGGKSFFDPGDYNSTALFDSLAAIFTSRGLTHDPSIPLLLQTEAGIVSTDAPLTKEFYVDSTVGKNTTLIVSFTTPVTVNLTGPGNITISLNTHPQLYLTGISGIVQVLLSDYAENGTWTYSITATQVASDVVITVQSSARTSGSDVLQVMAWLPEESNLVFAPDRMLGIYAEVTRGRSSVLNSRVVALVERPTSERLQIELLDNGVGSDIIKDDGIYSAYILAKDLAGDGRYSIKILVEGVEGVTSVAVGGQGRSSGLLAVNTIESTEKLETEKLGRFQRVRSAGEFSVSGFPLGMTTVPDRIPPSRITDLVVISDDAVDGSAEIEWTSVGGDMDRGTAASYTFYYTTDLDLATSRDSLFKWSEVNETYLLDLKPPQPAGNRERMKVDLALLGDNDTLFLCLRATDDSGNAGELSNLVSITRFRDADVPLETTDVDHVPPETTDVDHVPPGRDAGFYVLVTVLPILAALALLVTGLLLAVRRSRKRKSLHVQKKMKELGSAASP